MYSDEFNKIFENFHNIRNQENLQLQHGFKTFELGSNIFKNTFYCKFNDLVVYTLDIFLDTFILISEDSSSNASSNSSSTLKLIGAYMEPLQMEEFQDVDVFYDFKLKISRKTSSKYKIMQKIIFYNLL